MKPSDKQAFGNLITDALGFYRRDVSTFALSVWWAACQPFDLEQVAKAITSHAMDPEAGRFAPLPADIVRELAGTRTDRSQLAWNKTLGAMASVGSWTSVAFDDAAIHAVIQDLGGWPQLCSTTNDELPFVQKRFCDAYRAYSTRPDIPHPAVLRGSHDLGNSKLNVFQLPTLIGDPAKAEAIARGPSKARVQLSHVADNLGAIGHQLDAAA